MQRRVLDKIAEHSLYGAGLSGTSVVYSYNLFMRYMSGRTVLELGPAEGLGTRVLVDAGLDVTVVDGAEAFCKDLQVRFPEIKVFCSLFEEIDLPGKYQNIILGHVLEHVDDPVLVLKHISKFLERDGRIYAAVPNARSLHRQAAVLMGLLSDEGQFSDLDRHHGHQRIYTPETFRSDFLKAGLSLDVFGGYWMKPLSNSQMEDSWSAEMIAAFFKLGERYPDIAGEIFIVASK